MYTCVFCLHALIIHVLKLCFRHVKAYTIWYRRRSLYPSHANGHRVFGPLNDLFAVQKLVHTLLR